VTFSGGIAEVTEDTDPRSALARADAALYRAKEEGRNRVVVG
jgi:diguanylate cyclase